MECSLIRKALDPYTIIPNFATEQFRIGWIAVTMRMQLKVDALSRELGDFFDVHQVQESLCT